MDLKKKKLQSLCLKHLKKGDKVEFKFKDGSTWTMDEKDFPDVFTHGSVQNDLPTEIKITINTGWD